MKNEYLAALKKEGTLTASYNHVVSKLIKVFFYINLESLFKMRIELVKLIANKLVQDLKVKADNTYKEMDDKLGERFLREMDSIKMLCNYIKFSIENKKKIKRELVLVQDEFLIDDVMISLN